VNTVIVGGVDVLQLGRVSKTYRILVLNSQVTDTNPYGSHQSTP